MNKLHYLKWPFIIIAFGSIAWVLGSMMKILHWQGSDIILLTSTVIIIAGLGFLIGKLMILKK